jgi:hypothetical protein
MGRALSSVKSLQSLDGNQTGLWRLEGCGPML